jgi:predicted enzyme related to lactoylglutathione lyase
MLFVKDIETVAAFYELHFGLERVGEPEDGYLELDGGGVRLALHAAKWCDGDNSDSPAKIVFESSNVHDAVAAFKKKGPKFGKIFEWKGFAFADTKDPENHPVQISSRPI